MIHDAHCHFFSTRFFEALARDKINLAPGDPVSLIPAALGWEPPGAPTALADRWVSELDQHDVTRVDLMASVPGDDTLDRAFMKAENTGPREGVNASRLPRVQGRSSWA